METPCPIDARPFGPGRTILTGATVEGSPS